MTDSRMSVVLRFARRGLLTVGAVSLAVASLAQEVPDPYEGCGNGGDGECAVLEIGGATGIAGESVEIEVALDVVGLWIAGVQLDMILPNELAIDPLDCHVAPDLGKQLFAALPPDRPDRRLRAMILSLTDIDPLSSATLFTCAVEIAPDAEPGRYPIECDFAVAADGATPGDRIPAESFGCFGGEIVVADPLPTPTAIPAVSSDERALVAGSSAGGGCSVDSGSRGAPSVLLLVPAALLWWRRRYA